MEKLKNFVRPVVQPVADLLGVSVLYAGIAMVAALLILAVALITIVALSKRSKKRKKALEKSKATPSAPADKPVEQASAAVEEPVVVAEAKAGEETEEQAEEQAEEKAEGKAEEIQPAPIAEKEEKATFKKSASAKKPAPKKAPVKKSLAGKWIVELKSADEFASKLLASNGEVMLSSEIYSSEEGARNGIATIIKWVENGNFVIYQDKKKNYYYKLKTSGNRLICVGEIYKSKEQCLSAVESVKRIAKASNIVDELVETAKYVDYTPTPLDMENLGLKGKWKVEAVEEGRFSARLYASNGQLMMATEEVASKKTALGAIESVKKNAIEGNFIIDNDKFGRYYYKLRNAQKSVICIGEAYDSLSACTKALESVRRFAVNSAMVLE